MEFIKLNINSTKPFYTDKLGKIYNQNYKELKCCQIGGSLFLNYILDNPRRTPQKHSVARLIYQTYFPKANLNRYNIFKKDPTIEHPYQIDNLKRVLKSRMPRHNKLPQRHSSKKNPIKRKFYEKLPQSQLNNLIILASSKKIKNTFLAFTFSVGRNTISKHRAQLSKMKIQN